MHPQEVGFDYTSWTPSWACTPEIPIISSDFEAMLVTGDQGHSQIQTQPSSEPRSRGRPRVYTARNESALEKRRAQVRNAQRAYQQRKDKAAQATNQRQNQIIEAFTDLATEVEKFLKISSDSNVLNGNEEVSAHMRRLRDTYENVIKRPCIRPEKEKQRAGNEGKRNRRQDSENSQSSQGSPINLPKARGPTEKGQSAVDNAIIRGDDSGLISFWVDPKDMKYCDLDFLGVVGDASS